MSFLGMWMPLRRKSPTHEILPKNGILLSNTDIPPDHLFSSGRECSLIPLIFSSPPLVPPKMEICRFPVHCVDPLLEFLMDRQTAKLGLESKLVRKPGSRKSRSFVGTSRFSMNLLSSRAQRRRWRRRRHRVLLLYTLSKIKTKQNTKEAWCAKMVLSPFDSFRVVFFSLSLLSIHVTELEKRNVRVKFGHSCFVFIQWF